MANQYNSRPSPAEAMWLNGELHLIRQRENWDEMLRSQVELDNLK
jgi:diaminopimelate decarboxylase